MSGILRFHVQIGETENTLVIEYGLEKGTKNWEQKIQGQRRQMLHQTKKVYFLSLPFV